MPRPNRAAQAYQDAAISQAQALGMTPEELAMVMAPMRDPNTVYVYPGTDLPPDGGGAALEGLDFKKFITIWPNYLDSNKTIPEGRRIAKEHACEEPVVEDIHEVLKYFQLRHAIEPYKRYPRDSLVLGRVKVELTGPDGSPKHPELPNRKALLVKLGELIPKLKSRKARLEAEAAAIKAQQVGAAQAATTGGNAKKKGKKKGGDKAAGGGGKR